SRPSKASSVRVWTCAQSSPAAWARLVTLLIVPSPTRRLRATARWLSRRAHFCRRISRTRRMASRSVAIAPLSSTGADDAVDHPASLTQAPAPGFGGRIACTPFTISDLRVHHPDLGVHDERSRCSRCADPRVHDGPIPAFTFGRYAQPEALKEPRVAAHHDA